MDTQDDTQLREIVASLRSTTNVVERLAGHVDSNLSTIADLRISVATMNQALSRLIKVVVDGNGTPPLVTRVAILENNAMARDSDRKVTRGAMSSIIVNIVSGIAGAVITLLMAKLAHP